MDESKMMACSCKPYNEFEETVQMMLSEDYKALLLNKNIIVFIN